MNRPGFDAHLLRWEGWHHAKQIRPGDKGQGVRLVTDHVGDYGSEWEAIATVAGRLGMSPETQILIE